jgi:tetratricopeptide (TPR) repeat protein
MPPKKKAATRARPAKRATKVAKPAIKRVGSTKPAKSKKRVVRPKVAERVASAKPAEPRESAAPARIVRDSSPLPKEEPSADSLFRAANAALDAGDVENAIELFTRAMELAPGNAALVQSRGAAYAIKGDARQAALDCEAAIEMNPTFSEAHLHCGLAYAELGEHGPAVSRLTWAIQLGLGQEAARVQAHMRRAGSLEALGEIRAAIDDLNTVVHLVPNTPTAELSAKRASALLARISS